MSITLKVNGKERTVDVDPLTPLLWVLRDTLGLTGPKFGCGIAECGACTVHLDGSAVRSCITDVGQAKGRAITTIEGLPRDLGEVLERAWIEEDVVQCGYCQPGQVMAAAALLREHPSPTPEEVNQAMKDILCRCGTYQRIRCAIRRAVELKAGGGK
ncbi:MAG: (2Fe-2S)-binding protein [Planctomycetes bacterium]|nr:(2Fe-2S)-binding protein [Planctomycetota bacterium]